MNSNKILAQYPNISLFQNLFAKLRFLIAPIDETIQLLPKKGNLLDIGCGYGFISNFIALSYPSLKILGVDINKLRIEFAKTSIGKRKNITFSALDVLNQTLPQEKRDVVLCFDILHHLPKYSHETLILQFYNILKKGGFLIIKEIDTTPFYKYCWNYIHDILVNKGQPIYCRSFKDWEKILQKYHLKVKQIFFPNSGFLYPHILILAHKI